MSEKNPRRGGRSKGPDKPPRPAVKPADEPSSGDGTKFDVVEEAGKESFPASDAPSWTP